LKEIKACSLENTPNGVFDLCMFGNKFIVKIISLTMRFALFVLIFLVLFSQTLLAQNNAETSFEHRIKVGIAANYFNYNERLAYLEVDRDFQPGISLGTIMDWRISPFNRIRLEPYYLYQRLLNRFDSQDVRVKSRFNQHILGVDFFPLVLKSNHRLQPTVSFGGFAQLLVLSRNQTTIDNQPISYTLKDINRLQTGWVAGAGFYIDQTLIELRLYNAMVNFYKNIETPNTIRNLSLILTF
jgi:hypothetical protein